MKAYSVDLRERILAAHDAGMPKFRIVQTYKVSGPTINRYIAQCRQTGDITPRQSPGRPRSIKPDQHPDLISQLQTTPDATLEEHRQSWLKSHGVPISVSTMHRAIKRVRWTRKRKR
jgi:transposase